ALDEITRFRLESDLAELQHRRGLTVIFVTHSVFESVYLGSRVVVLSPRPGRVAASRRIEGPTPRVEAFRTSAAYLEACREVSSLLAAATKRPLTLPLSPSGGEGNVPPSPSGGRGPGGGGAGAWTVLDRSSRGAAPVVIRMLSPGGWASIGRVRGLPPSRPPVPLP